MATHAPITGAPTRALSNVIRLSTAASRKVQQPTARRCAKAVAAGAAVPLPADYMSSIERKQLEDIEIFASLRRTPELLLVMALLHTAGSESKARVLGTCIGAKIHSPDCTATRQALAVARSIFSGSAVARSV